VLAGHGDNVAIVWESPVTGVTEKYTYARLLDEVEVLAGVLREEGVQKGDVVIIYSMQTNNFVIVQVGNHQKQPKLTTYRI
jgi:acyl-coenzyme A synthetase/AMP-(fatty) acid ligase